VKLPIGFQFAGVAAGIKPQRPDLALVYSAAPCSAAGMFTINKAKAAPVIDAEARLPAAGMHAVVLNSGNANALTGPRGLEAVTAVQAAVAQALGIPASSIVSASTGIIGVVLPVAKLLAAVPKLVGALGPEPETAADAIITTDTCRKLASRVIELGGHTVTLSAIAKGSGMIAPQLATMITVLTTDCAIAPDLLKLAIAGAARETFERLTIDDDMSTNDCVLALANGLANNRSITAQGADLDAFAAAVTDLFRELARAIAADGEGSTKRIEVRVTGAPDVATAADLARAVAGSTLVKAAVFGADPNWGRVLATIGARAGSQHYDVNPYRAAVAIQGTAVYDGGPVELDRTALRTKLREPEVAITVDVRAGTAEATAWGCDLTYDYVKLNADYTSLIVETPGGGVAKDDRFTNYSPKLKVAMLVQALSYISRFRGQRCVIACSGAALASESLLRALCEDVLLLRSVGLVPVVVHGGGAVVERALDRLGTTPDFQDGVRVTSAADQRVVEMVLTGQISAELVTLLNRHGANAVGLSGKDGAMLRATRLVGHAGELAAVDASLVDLMLGKGYVPVISPIGLGEDGTSYHLDVRAVAAALAGALGAEKLIVLDDAPGIVRDGDLVSEVDKTSIEDLAIRRALDGGVRAVHLLDGRVPHSMIAELFTDSGVGTVVR